MLELAKALLKSCPKDERLTRNKVYELLRSVNRAASKAVIRASGEEQPAIRSASKVRPRTFIRSRVVL